MQNKNQIRWACRRGMLELDLLLLPFFEDGYDDLSQEKQLAFQRLLKCTDPEIYSWLMQNTVPDDKELAEIVSEICQHKTC